MKNLILFSSLLLILAAFSCNPKDNLSDSPAETEEKLSDEELMTLVQEKTFQYFWDGAEPHSGLARERFHVDGVYPQDDKNVITSGGGGFGLMAILVGIERGFISREEGVDRLLKIADFLKTCDRFHGAWPHWMYGESGKTKPFSKNDDGGDIVETSFMAQGLICVREYFKDGNEQEQQLAAAVDTLWREIDWNWYRGPEQENILYWHWSPNVGWEMNHKIFGYNECLITYVMAACSPTHPIPAEVYHEGWARGGEIKGEATPYGLPLALEHNGSPEYGGPLFWAHYSFLGLDPRNLSDQYADYWEHNKNHTLVNRRHCIENPHNYKGYGENAWGLTSSYSIKGYAGHKPARDLGVISPTAALSSIPYTPEESMKVMRYFYEELGDKLMGPYGFYDAYSAEENWFPQKYLAIDQGPIVVMIENHRSGLLWDLFMQAPEVQNGLKKLGFNFQ